MRHRPLLITHELSLSGAPIALLALAKSLVRLGERPIVTYLKDGPLRASFVDAGIEIGQKVYPDELSLVIANTVFSVPVALGMRSCGIPIAGWIHEPLSFISQLNVPIQAMGLSELDLLLTPSGFLLDDLTRQVRPRMALQLSNTVAQEHYRLDSDEAFHAVTGAWTAHKAQAELLALTRLAGIACRYNFIGAACPENLRDAPEVRPHRFMGSVPHETAKREIARCVAFVSGSRMEIQPLSSIEALMAGRPALLSDIPAHRSLARRVPNVFLFDRTRPDAFRQGWQRLEQAIPDVALGLKASRAARALFGAAAFDARLSGILGLLRGHAAPDFPIYQDDDALPSMTAE